MMQTFMGAATNIASLVTDLSMVLVISIYWNADNVRFERLWLSLVPVARRGQAREAWQEIQEQLGRYIRGEVLQILLAGGLLWAGYAIMGLPYPALLAVFGAVVRMVPWLGIALALVSPLLLGLTSGPALAAVATVYTLVVMLVIERGMHARFFAQRQYSSLLVGLTVATLALRYGLLGAVLAPLLAVIVQLVGGRLLEARLKPPEPVTEAEIEPLREQLRQVRAQLLESDQEPTPEIRSLIERLDSLVASTQKAL
jgi:predicted PurR-regulated permease PerM